MNRKDKEGSGEKKKKKRDSKTNLDVHPLLLFQSHEGGSSFSIRLARGIRDCSYFGLYFFFILSKEKLIGEPGLGILRDDRYVIPLQRRNVLFSLVDRCCLKF